MTAAGGSHDAAFRDHRCAACGYGVSVRTLPAHCPMCGGGGDWREVPRRAPRTHSVAAGDVPGLREAGA